MASVINVIYIPCSRFCPTYCFRSFTSYWCLLTLTPFCYDVCGHSQIRHYHIHFFPFLFHILSYTHTTIIKSIRHMAVATGKAQCVTCGKQKVAYLCAGCSQNFCFNHLAEHHQTLEKQLDEVEDKRNLFRETLTQQKNNPQEHPLLQQINIWERSSVSKIRQTAEEARQLLVQHTVANINDIEIKLVKLTEQLKQTRNENDVNEIVLNQFKQKLKQLEEELAKPPHISIREESSSFISKISVIIASGKCRNPI